MLSSKVEILYLDDEGAVSMRFQGLQGELPGWLNEKKKKNSHN